MDDLNVYWTEADGLMKVPLNGGAVATLAVWSSPTCSEPFVIADGVNVYWIELPCAEYTPYCEGTLVNVMEVSRAGGNAVTLVSALPTFNSTPLAPRLA